MNPLYASTCPIDGRFCQERSGCDDCQVMRRQINPLWEFIECPLEMVIYPN